MLHTHHRLLLIVYAAALAGIGLWWFTRPMPEHGGRVTIDWAAAPTPGFAKALAPRQFTYPADLGPHLAYQTEWWYYTGNLESPDGRHFGYQLTFFRRGLSPTAIDREGSMATREIYFTHFAITDVAAGTHSVDERFSRQADGLAGAQASPYKVWLEDWQVQSIDQVGNSLHLQARSGGQALDLQLHADKPYIANGDNGLSAKGPQLGNASYYMSGTRMAAQGHITANGHTFAVTGLSWFDHEWSTSALSEEAVGWDWFSLQLSNGRDLMFFQIRNRDGTLSPVSSGTLVEPDGSVVHLKHDDVKITVDSTWRSPESGADYPSTWRLRVPSQGIELHIEPWLADQENRVSVTYWEGAVQATGTQAGVTLSGNGYVELTGYSGSLGGAF
jgi:predicted secreted hydrolase